MTRSSQVLDVETGGTAVAQRVECQRRQRERATEWLRYGAGDARLWYLLRYKPRTYTQRWLGDSDLDCL